MAARTFSGHFCPSRPSHSAHNALITRTKAYQGIVCGVLACIRIVFRLLPSYKYERHHRPCQSQEARGTSRGKLPCKAGTPPDCDLRHTFAHRPYLAHCSLSYVYLVHFMLMYVVDTA